MKKEFFYLLIFAFIIAITNTGNTAKAQTTHRDYSGVIQKYDPSFNGIGPEVYFLPKPRSKAEKITDEFEAIQSFNDSITYVSLYKDLISSYANTSNYIYIKDLIQNESISLNNWQKIIDNEQSASNYALVVGFLNEFAKQSILQKNYSQAELLLKKALETPPTEYHMEDKSILLSNLYSLYIFNKKLDDALLIEQESLQEAQRNKSLLNQGHSLINLAMIQAYNNNFIEAENTIIRKAIPLFNKGNSFEAKIKAWVKLAEIYMLNKQYPEAQWFLIQAQDLSDKKKITKYNTFIEFMLGGAKFHQNNLRVSQKELEKALILAKESGDKYIELSIMQMLGEISIKQNRIDDAEAMLKSYWELRNKLF